MNVRRRATRELGWVAPRKPRWLLKAAEDEDPRVRIAAHSAVRLKGVDVEKLESIHKAWSKKSEYRNANKDLTRTIAVIKYKACWDCLPGASVPWVPTFGTFFHLAATRVTRLLYIVINRSSVTTVLSLIDLVPAAMLNL